MSKTVTFNELRKIKDSLQDGAIGKIAEKLGVNEETVRNYFGGHNFKKGDSAGIHISPGPDGGIVVLDNTEILELALQYVKE